MGLGFIMFFGGVYLCFFCVYYVIFIQNIKKFFLYYLYSFDFFKMLSFYKNIILNNL